MIRVDGHFARGDAVVVRGPDSGEIGRGLVAYDADDAENIKGRSSPDVMSILGISGRAEMIHRDDLVIGPARPGKANRPLAEPGDRPERRRKPRFRGPPRSQPRQTGISMLRHGLNQDLDPTCLRP